MSRRIVPLTFYVGMLLVGVMLCANVVGAARSPVLVTGVWDGFYQTAGDESNPGILRSVINQQSGRSITGDAQLLDSEGVRLFNAYNFHGAAPRDNFITGAGVSLTGHMVLQADLETFAGVDGDAGVMYPQFRFLPGQRPAIDVNAILLRPFPDVDSLDIAGDGTGTFHSFTNPDFRGRIDAEMLDRERGSFPGHVSFLPISDQDLPFSWQCRATTSEDGRIIMIGQGKTGTFIADGAVNPAVAGVLADVSKTNLADTPAFSVNLMYLLRRGGGIDFGAINFTLAR